MDKNIADEDSSYFFIRKIYYSPQNKNSMTLEVEEATKYLPDIEF